jgi:hypothetical protein
MNNTYEIEITLEANIPGLAKPYRTTLCIGTLPLRTTSTAIERDRAKEERARYLGIQLDRAYKEFKNTALAYVRGGIPEKDHA